MLRAIARIGLMASLAFALVTRAYAQTPVPVPVEEPKPRPVPVPPNAPPPTNDKTPYPVPIGDPKPTPAPQQPPSNPTPPPGGTGPGTTQPKPTGPGTTTPTGPGTTTPTGPGTTTPTGPGTTTPTGPGTTTPGTTTPPGQGTIPPPTTTPSPIPPVMPKVDTKLESKPDLQVEQKLETPSPKFDPTVPQTPLVGSATIKDIVVEENKKTDADTVILIARLEKGDEFRADMVEEIKQRLITSGLFKDVTVYWSMVQGGVRVHLMVKDKHSWVIAPAFYNQPTNVGGGVGFGENNLFGQNQKLLIYGQIATGDSFFIGAWVIPALGGTRFYAQLDTYLKSARNIEYASPTRYAAEDSNNMFAGANPLPLRESRINYLNFGAKLGIELFRGVKIDSRLRAASVSYKDIKLAQMDTDGDGKPDTDVPIEQVVGDPAMPVLPDCIDATMNPPPPGCGGTDVSNEWSLTIDRRANYYGIQDGYRYTVSVERSLTALGSDYDYWLAGLSIYRAKKLFERHNFVIKGSINKGKNLPFQQEYKVGGTSMRGWLNDQFRGDFKTQINAEYSLPIFPTIKGLSIRGLAFIDSAYTTFFDANAEKAKRHYLPGAEVRGLDGFKNTVGVGTRFYLRQIVLPLLGLDFGYGLEARDFQVYLAIGLTD